ERESRTAGEVAALDAEIVDSFGKIEDIVALEAQVVKSVHPLAAGIEMTDLAGVASFADFNVPGTHARALETGTKRHTILIQAFGFVGDDRAAPVELGNATPVFAVANAGETFLDRRFARRNRFRPADAGVDQSMLVMQTRPFGAPGDQ